MEAIFSISNLLVLPFWALMILAPRWRGSQRIVGSLWIVVPPALLYAALVLPGMGQLLPALANPSLNGIAALLGQPKGAVIGWVHFLAFDLFVGRWLYLDSQARGSSPWLTSPILLAVLMFGPLGLLLYLLARAFSIPQESSQ